MSDTSKTRIEGKVDDLKGRTKEAWGDVSGDEQAKAEGQADQMLGKIKQGVADAKDKIDDAVDKITNSDKS